MSTPPFPTPELLAELRVEIRHIDPAALEEHARNLQAAANAEIKRLCQGESPLRHRAIADRVVETLIGPNWDVISRTTFGGYPEIALTGYHG